MDWHAHSVTSILEGLKTSEKGLTGAEVKERFAKYGKNVLRKEKTKSKFRVFLEQFHSLLVYVLIFVAIISIFIGHWLDAIVIGAVVIINAIIGFIQEYKAEAIIEKLKKSLQYKVMVNREGVHKEIDSQNLVPGDIIILDEGDKILADCRIIEQDNLQINEAILTGESFPVEKNEKTLKKEVVLADRKNLLYAGTSVVRGKALAVVVDTGMRTEFGKLAELVQTTTDEKMPLEEKMDTFSKNISIAILVFVSVAFVVGISMGIDKVEMFLVSVSLAVAAIPSALPAIIAITLAIAIKQMYKVNTLIRRLPAVETLGRATVICTDKTGTLTEEQLKVDKIYSNKILSVSGIKELGIQEKQIFKIGLLCNNARDEKDEILGDPTEVALIKVAKKYGILKKEVIDQNSRVKEFPFDSERKMMSIIRENGKIKTSYVKGAPLFVLDKCTKEFVNGKIKLMTAKRKKELAKISRVMEGGGLRVLGFGFRQITKISQEEAENHLIFSGFTGMIDPPRIEVKEAIAEAISAGITVKIITGDSAFTTLAIAQKLGLNGNIIEGKELDKLPDEKWYEIVRDKTIFARITPQQKLRIVETIEKQNETVAVTGDGVNDILALKKANIGIAMGVRGSDVARDSSDMVLLDDNFASIIKAVRQGRRVFDNMKKSLKFLLAANTGEVLVVIAALLFGWPLIFLPLAILWMNLVTDSLPALALAVEPAESDVMIRKPRKDGLLAGIWQWIIVAGVFMVLSSLIVFNYGMNHFSIEVARTMAITTAIFFELFFAFSCKSGKTIFVTGILDNKYLIYSILISGGLHLVAIYTLLGSVFGFVSLTGFQLGISTLAGLSGLIVFEGWKIGKSLIKSRR